MTSTFEAEARQFCQFRPSVAAPPIRDPFGCHFFVVEHFGKCDRSQMRQVFLDELHESKPRGICCVHHVASVPFMEQPECLNGAGSPISLCLCRLPRRAPARPRGTTCPGQLPSALQRLPLLSQRSPLLVVSSSSLSSTTPVVAPQQGPAGAVVSTSRRSTGRRSSRTTKGVVVQVVLDKVIEILVPKGGSNSIPVVQASSISSPETLINRSSNPAGVSPRVSYVKSNDARGLFYST